MNFALTSKITRVKVKNHKPRRKTVGITLPQNSIRRTQGNGSNISRIREQALLSILGYLETRNETESSKKDF